MATRAKLFETVREDRAIYGSSRAMLRDPLFPSRKVSFPKLVLGFFLFPVSKPIIGTDLKEFLTDLVHLRFRKASPVKS